MQELRWRKREKVVNQFSSQNKHLMEMKSKNIGSFESYLCKN